MRRSVVAIRRARRRVPVPCCRGDSPAARTSQRHAPGWPMLTEDDGQLRLQRDRSGHEHGGCRRERREGRRRSPTKGRHTEIPSSARKDRQGSCVQVYEEGVTTQAGNRTMRKIFLKIPSGGHRGVVVLAAASMCGAAIVAIPLVVSSSPPIKLTHYRMLVLQREEPTARDSTRPNLTAFSCGTPHVRSPAPGFLAPPTPRTAGRTSMPRRGRCAS